MLKTAKFQDGSVKIITDITGQKMKKTFKTEELFRDWLENAIRSNQGNSMGLLQRSGRG
jgi:hypothetical protein